MTLKEKINLKATELHDNAKQISKEQLERIGGGHDSHFGKGCDGTWTDKSCDFMQSCQP
ncbi:hypothetical protein ACFOEE_09340 [Pseudoalteromonas fenneropenaei]|uniref:Bacteriocin n=1 Tax=Pseudoalteromonas fenneropenaei TaxID=1737459 RepID=A0ABV7CJA4_9GAMM